MSKGIEYTLGGGLVARLYMQSEQQRALARKHMWRRYWEGVQLAFCYYENSPADRLMLIRLRAFMRGSDETYSDATIDRKRAAVERKKRD